MFITDLETFHRELLRKRPCCSAEGKGRTAISPLWVKKVLKIWGWSLSRVGFRERKGSARHQVPNPQLVTRDWEFN